MATLAQKIKCEQDAREMLRQGGLPDPDRVEYGHGCIRLFWEESKLVLVVDIDKPPEGLDVVGEYIEDLAEVGERLEVLDDEEAAEEDDFDYEDAVNRLKTMDDTEEAA